MIEFKFACPSCGQHIQVTDAYSGLQVNCPACQKPMLVPEAPGTLPPRAAMGVPPAPSAQSEPVVPMMEGTVSGSKKSTIKWVVIGSTAGLVVVSAVAFVLSSG